MENPWGEPSPPLAPSSAAVDDAYRTHGNDDRKDDRDDTAGGLESAPRLSLELPGDEDDDAPAWDAQDSPDGVHDADAWESEARANRLSQGNDVLKSEPEGDDLPSQEGIAPPIPVVPAANLNVDFNAPQQQMDDFPEDDDGNDDELPTATTDAFESGTGGGGGGADDDFDDFGDAATAPAGPGADNDDDFGDFGDFGEAAPLDETAFEAAPAPEQTPFPSSSLASAPASFSHQPFASTSTATAYPPLRFDVSDPSRQAISSQLHDFWDAAFPAAARAVTDEPERQVEGVAQVLVTESSCVH